MHKSPLRHFPLYRTHDLGVMKNSLANWGITDYAIADRTYQYNIDLVALRDMVITYGSCSSKVQMRFSGVDFMRHRICLSGSGHSTASRFSTDLNQSQWSAIVPAGESGGFEFEAGYEEIRMVVDDGLMQKKLGALIGDAPVDRIVFKSDSDTQSPGLARYRRLLSLLLAELEEGGPQAPGLVINEIAEAMLVSYFCGQKHNFSDRLLTPERAPSSQQLRNAEDYIATHWQTSLSIEDIARATNVSARSIFRSFKETHGCSPFQYLKRVRLQHARAMLIEEGAQHGVISVALKCGFQSLGHFASSYRDAFGELPSQTARR